MGLEPLTLADDMGLPGQRVPSVGAGSDRASRSGSPYGFEHGYSYGVEAGKYVGPDRGCWRAEELVGWEFDYGYC